MEEHLEAKRQHILRLESKLDKQQINEALLETSQEPRDSLMSKDCEMLEEKEKTSTECLETQEIEDDDEEELSQQNKDRNCDVEEEKEKELLEEDHEEEETCKESNKHNEEMDEECSDKQGLKDIQIKKETQ